MGDGQVSIRALLQVYITNDDPPYCDDDAEKLHHPGCILLEKKQISLISNAKSDFSVNKNLKREEEALDTDAEIQHNIL